MTLTFKQMLIADAKEIFLNLNEFGEAITYTPIATGTAKVLVGVIKDEPEIPIDWDDGTGTKATLEVHISNDATSGVVSPARLDSLLIRGATYYVRNKSGPDVDGTWNLDVVKVDVDEKGSIRRVNR